MLMELGCVQIIVFTTFVLIERIWPARPLERGDWFGVGWLAVNLLALFWANVWVVLYTGWVGGSEFSLLQALGFYLAYSFTNYWVHRAKHQWAWLWHYVHRFHHSAGHMETAVTFYKHPFEYAFNTLCLVGLGAMFSVSVEVIAFALVVEGCLECFHHSNIRTPRRLRWIGFLIQTPEMHLVHHEYGRHRFNYVAFLWDWVFGTLNDGSDWSGRVGFRDSPNVIRYFTVK